MHRRRLSPLCLLLAALAACAPATARPRTQGDAAAEARQWRAIADQRRDSRDWRGERKALEHVVALQPGDARAWYALGRATRGRGTLGRRIAAWRRAAALDSTYREPRFALGMQLGETRDGAEEALRWFDEARRLGEGGRALYWRGRALLTLERWDEAHAAFVAAGEAGHRLAWDYGSAAYALSRLGRHAKAVAEWDRALAIDGNYFNVVAREYNMIPDEKSAWKRSRRAIGRD